MLESKYSVSLPVCFCKILLFFGILPLLQPIFVLVLVQYTANGLICAHFQIANDRFLSLLILQNKTYEMKMHVAGERTLFVFSLFLSN